MTSRITRVNGRIRVNATNPKDGSRSIRGSSGASAVVHVPPGESTPRASGLDSRCSPSCSLTSGGPSSRGFTEYQKASGRSGPPSRTFAAFRMATKLRLSYLYADLAFIPPARNRTERRGARKLPTPGPGRPAGAEPGGDGEIPTRG